MEPQFQTSGASELEKVVRADVMSYFDEVQEEAEGLVKLLNDRQSGLMTWNEFVGKRLKKLAQLYVDEGGVIEQ